MYSLKVRKKLDKKLMKISKKNKELIRQVEKKVKEIRKNSNRYKNLRAPLNDWKRIHLLGESRVLCFSVDEKNKAVILEDLDTHDNIYK